MTSETADWIVRISHDGVVTFADHLTPEEGAERAWGLLLQIAEQHGSNLERALTAKDARIAELEELVKLAYIEGWGHGAVAFGGRDADRLIERAERGGYLSARNVPRRFQE